MLRNLIKLKSNSIYDTIYPLQFSSKIYGLTCYSLKPNKRAFISFLDLLFILVAFYVHYTFIKIFVSFNLFKVESDSKIAQMGYPMLMASIECIAIINMFASLFFRKENAKVVEYLSEIDEKVCMHFL